VTTLTIDLCPTEEIASSVAAFRTKRGNTLLTPAPPGYAGPYDEVLAFDGINPPPAKDKEPVSPRTELYPASDAEQATPTFVVVSWVK